MNTHDVKGTLVTILKGHYSFEDFEFNDFFLNKKVKELDFDSIAILELFLVVEEGFDLKEKLSSRIEMKEALELTASEFIEVISKTVEDMLEAS
jgi:acyl carrier protein